MAVGYPKELPDWERRVWRFLENAKVWGFYTPWPSEWTNLLGRPRCARCGTTKVPNEIRFGTIDGKIPACEACTVIVSRVGEDRPLPGVAK